MEQNERYLHLAGKLLDAKEQAAAFKLEKNKQGQKEAQEKIRKFQRGKHFQILRYINTFPFLAFPVRKSHLFNLSTKSQFIRGLGRLSVTSQIKNMVGCVGHIDSLTTPELAVTA